MRIKGAKMKQIIIGRKDRADLPDFGLFDVPVKIDSGAYTSSIDCKSSKLIEKNGEKILEVIFLNSDRNDHSNIPYYFKEYKTKKVKSSTGQSQFRYLIPGRILLFDREYLTYFSLSKRIGMKFPILLGRKLLNKNFIIDTRKVNLSNNLKNK